MKSLISVVCIAAAFEFLPAAAPADSRLLREPDISATRIVFTMEAISGRSTGPGARPGG